MALDTDYPYSRQHSGLIFYLHSSLSGSRDARAAQVSLTQCPVGRRCRKQSVVSWAPAPCKGDVPQQFFPRWSFLKEPSGIKHRHSQLSSGTVCLQGLQILLCKESWVVPFFFKKNPKPNQNTNPNNGGGSGKQNMHALCCTQEPWLRRAALREDPVGNTTL